MNDIIQADDMKKIIAITTITLIGAGFIILTIMIIIIVLFTNRKGIYSTCITLSSMVIKATNRMIIII